MGAWKRREKVPAEGDITLQSHQGQLQLEALSQNSGLSKQWRWGECGSEECGRGGMAGHLL